MKNSTHRGTIHEKLRRRSFYRTASGFHRQNNSAMPKGTAPGGVPPLAIRYVLHPTNCCPTPLGPELRRRVAADNSSLKGRQVSIHHWAHPVRDCLRHPPLGSPFGRAGGDQPPERGGDAPAGNALRTASDKWLPFAARPRTAYRPLALPMGELAAISRLRG